MSDTMDVKHLKKEEFERVFYDHYFKNIAIHEDMEIECFYQPRNSSTIDEEKKRAKGIEKRNIKRTITVLKEYIPKTINCKYIQLISKSSQFIQDFFQCLKHELIADHSRSIEKKINSIVSEWTNSLKENKNLETLITEICRKLEKNNKLKLPWTTKEIQTAIFSVEKLFKNNNTPANACPIKQN